MAYCYVLTFHTYKNSEYFINQVKFLLTFSDKKVGWEAYRMTEGEDFLYFIGYCEEDIRETIRWLEIMDELQVADAITMISLLYEARELHGVFVALLENRKLAG